MFICCILTLTRFLFSFAFCCISLFPIVSKLKYTGLVDVSVDDCCGHSGRLNEELATRLRVWIMSDLVVKHSRLEKPSHCVVGASLFPEFVLADRMPPSDFFDWWSKETQKGTPVVVTMENPNWSMLEIKEPNATFQQVDKDRGKNAKQLTWVLLLKAHRAAGCVAWLATGLWTLLGAIKKRLIFRQGVAMETEKSHKGKLFKFLKAFLAFSLAALVFEVVAHMKGWHFSTPHLYMPTTTGIQDSLHLIYFSWVQFRSNYIAPPIQTLADICIILFLIQSLDRIILCIGCFWIKYKKIKPQPKVESPECKDIEQPGSGHPMVLLQIPMCNEREV